MIEYDQWHELLDVHSYWRNVALDAVLANGSSGNVIVEVLAKPEPPQPHWLERWMRRER